MSYDAVIIVQARMESSRLTGKVLKPLAGKPLIFHLLERLSVIQCKDIITSVSNAKESECLLSQLRKNNFKAVSGHPTDLYKRYLETIKFLGTDAKAIVRVTADNPLTDCNAICEGIEKLIKENLDYVCMGNAPKGCGCDIFKTESFKTFEKEQLSPYEAEHIIPIYRNRPYLKRGLVACKFPEGADKLSLTVDTAEDYQKMKEIFSLYYSEKEGISIYKVVNDLLR